MDQNEFALWDCKRERFVGQSYRTETEVASEIHKFERNPERWNKWHDHTWAIVRRENPQAGHYCHHSNGEYATLADMLGMVDNYLRTEGHLPDFARINEQTDIRTIKAPTLNDQGTRALTMGLAASPVGTELTLFILNPDTGDTVTISKDCKEAMITVATAMKDALDIIIARCEKDEQ